MTAIRVYDAVWDRVCAASRTRKNFRGKPFYRAALTAPVLGPLAVLEPLQRVEEKRTSGERQIAEQRKLIAKLEANGSPATPAKYLSGIELLQAARLDNRDRLLEQLKQGVK